MQSVVRPLTLAANAWNLSPWACLAQWAVALRIPTATGCTATAEDGLVCRIEQFLRKALHGLRR